MRERFWHSQSFWSVRFLTKTQKNIGCGGRQTTCPLDAVNRAHVADKLEQIAKEAVQGFPPRMPTSFTMMRVNFDGIFHGFSAGLMVTMRHRRFDA
jgi:hypothetical protein